MRPCTYVGDSSTLNRDQAAHSASSSHRGFLPRHPGNSAGRVADVNSSSVVQSTVGYGAFSWALLFSATHVYWACGGTVFLGKYQDQSAKTLLPQDPWI
jgi:hypothetical protein